MLVRGTLPMVHLPVGKVHVHVHTLIHTHHPCLKQTFHISVHVQYRDRAPSQVH